MEAAAVLDDAPRVTLQSILNVGLLTQVVVGLPLSVLGFLHPHSLVPPPPPSPPPSPSTWSTWVSSLFTPFLGSKPPPSSLMHPRGDAGLQWLSEETEEAGPRGEEAHLVRFGSLVVLLVSTFSLLAVFASHRRRFKLVLTVLTTLAYGVASAAQWRAKSATLSPGGPFTVLSTLALVGLLSLLWAFSSVLVNGTGRVRVPALHGHTLHHERAHSHQRRHDKIADHPEGLLEGRRRGGGGRETRQGKGEGPDAHGGRGHEVLRPVRAE